MDHCLQGVRTIPRARSKTLLRTGRCTGRPAWPGFRSLAAPFGSFQRSRSPAMEASPRLKRFDPEIVDIAKYVHRYEVQSELAVRLFVLFPSGSVASLQSNLLGIFERGLTVSAFERVVRYCPSRLSRYSRLWARSPQIPRVSEAPRTRCRRYRCLQRHSGSGHRFPVGSRQRSVQYWCHDQVARLQ